MEITTNGDGPPNRQNSESKKGITSPSVQKGRKKLAKGKRKIQPLKIIRAPKESSPEYG